ncbi:MAG: hypothetical protein SV760_00580 [Halobacteria archaeon]|nr:hypothetical protein [Halobacteria archaeon]
MAYKIGIVGAGHWSKRLNTGIEGDHPLEIHKTLDVLPYEEKRDLLEALDIPERRHHTISPGDPLPDDFFEGLDVVQIASPIEYHKNQTLESLKRGKFTITEKSYGATRDEFEEVLSYIESNDLEDSSYLHLHYLKKLLTLRMPEVVSRAVEKHGYVDRVETAFLEKESEEDKGRSWLFEPENGGVFLDWIHPIEVLVSGCSATFTELIEARGYLVNEGYTTKYPTAARAEYRVEGEYFSDGATATVRVGKGFDGVHQKTMRLVLEDGAHVDFIYADSEEEFETDYRGRWIWREVADGSVRNVDEARPKGPIPYLLLIEDLTKALEGDGSTPLSPDEKRRIYEPVWEFNRAVEMDDPVRDDDEIQEYVDEALRTTTKRKTLKR